MNGFARTFFAASAVVLRALSHVFVFPAERLRRASAWCERQAEIGTQVPR